MIVSKKQLVSFTVLLLSAADHITNVSSFGSAASALLNKNRQPPSFCSQSASTTARTTRLHSTFVRDACPTIPITTQLHPENETCLIALG
mmetsp:Transcript_2562/g.3418  ORF Transcript_2562/g.3418 Transcript_2562/m.3418 type:complete len:90 (-) Transcript_2562:714-983(-)